MLGLPLGTSFTIAVLLQSPDEDAGRWQMETWPLVFWVLKLEDKHDDGTTLDNRQRSSQGGEAQRIKLATELQRNVARRFTYSMNRRRAYPVGRGKAEESARWIGRIRKRRAAWFSCFDCG